MVYIKDFDDQHLGGIDLRRVIFARYSMARGLVDSYRLNNDLVQKHEHVYWMLKKTDDHFHEQMAFGHFQALVEYAESSGTLPSRSEELNRYKLSPAVNINNHKISLSV